MLDVKFSLPFLGMWLWKEDRQVYYLVEMEVRLPLGKTLGEASRLPCLHEIQCMEIPPWQLIFLPPTATRKAILMDRWKRGQVAKGSKRRPINTVSTTLKSQGGQASLIGGCTRRRLFRNLATLGWEDIEWPCIGRWKAEMTARGTLTKLMDGPEFFKNERHSSISSIWVRDEDKLKLLGPDSESLSLERVS